MILDTIDNASRYYPLHPGFKTGFEHLKSVDVQSLESGRYDIDGDRVFMIINRGPGKGKSKARLENHKRYIDIQGTISGTDLIGWKHLADCADDGQGYNDEKDLEFYTGMSDVWIPSPPGTFCLFFPEDVHAPKGAEEELFKVIIKVAVE